MSLKVFSNLRDPVILNSLIHFGMSDSLGGVRMSLSSSTAAVNATRLAHWEIGGHLQREV